MINEVVKVQIDENLVRSIFSLFKNELTKRIGLSEFQRLVSLANKVHLLYLKLKFQFGPRIEQIKKKLIEEFQKSDITKGDGYIKLQDLNLLFNSVNLEIGDEDIQRL